MVKDEEDWTAEKITYAAAYGNERAIAYLFLPKKAKPPFQTVLFFPGIERSAAAEVLALHDRSSGRHPARADAPCCIPCTRARMSAATAWSPMWPT